MLLHYSGVIQRLGPLVRLWCMHYQAKHNYFVRVAEKGCNFKNICKTLAVRHQVHMLAKMPIMEHTMELSSVKKEFILEYNLQHLIVTYFGFSHAVEISKITFYNWCEKVIYYKTGFFICSGFDKDDYLEFEEIFEFYDFRQRMLFSHYKMENDSL